jgi:hypothetical protein
MASNDSPAKIIDKHWFEIKNNLSVYDDLLARLVGDGVITDPEKAPL